MTPRPEQPAAPPGAAHAGPIGLRRWFLLFVVWMIALTIGAKWGLNAGGDGSPVGLAVWLLCLYAFYMSLCCVFFPGPTSGAVMLMASDMIAADLGVTEHPLLRLGVVATVGAFATGMANLNEYHVFTYLLTFGRVRRVRDTRAYRLAARWFETNPFAVIFVFSLIPIPVDVIRWLAILARYSRPRFFLAYFLGRWIRYAIWCVVAMGLALTAWHIAWIQVLLVLAALAKIVHGMIRARGPQASPVVESTTPELQPVCVPVSDGTPLDAAGRPR